MKQDKVASIAPDSVTSTSEAMSTFDPKNQPLFDVVVDAPEKPTVSKEITE
jgi:hypothetical protein